MNMLFRHLNEIMKTKNIREFQSSSIRHVYSSYRHDASQQNRTNSTDQVMYVFSRENKILQKERAALQEDVDVYDYVKEEVGYRLSDRIYDIKRKFDKVVDLGCGRGYISKNIQSSSVGHLIMCDNSKTILEQAPPPEDTNVSHEKLNVDEENLPFEDNSIDLVISNLALHWVNDLPGCFQQIMKCLKNDGVFLASLFGGETLYELRSSIQLAETERLGGVAPHLSPFTQIRDVGSLLNRAGFNMLTIDVDELVINYPSMFELMWDLKGMAENNASLNRTLHFARDTQYAAASIYDKFYGVSDNKVNTNNDSTTSIPATFQIIYLVAWKPDPSQPKPLARGSGEVSLKDLHRIDEIAKLKGFIKIDENKD